MKTKISCLVAGFSLLLSGSCFAQTKPDPKHTMVYRIMTTVHGAPPHPGDESYTYEMLDAEQAEFLFDSHEIEKVVTEAIKKNGYIPLKHTGTAEQTDTYDALWIDIGLHPNTSLLSTTESFLTITMTLSPMSSMPLTTECNDKHIDCYQSDPTLCRNSNTLQLKTLDDEITRFFETAKATRLRLEQTQKAMQRRLERARERTQDIPKRFPIDP